MTDNEIRKRAEEFAKKMEEQLETGIYDCEEDLKIEESYNEGYINGLEEGYYQAMKDCYSAWHDLNIERIHNLFQFKPVKFFPLKGPYSM